MARTFSTVTLEAEHVPETHRTLENDHTVSQEELPGMVNVYLVVDGARILFTQYKASKILDVLDAHEQNKPQTVEASAADEPAQV